MGLKFMFSNGKPSYTPLKIKCEKTEFDTVKNGQRLQDFCGIVNFFFHSPPTEKTSYSYL